ncbi:transglycosylase family protein [Macrococcus bovicus]|uniref:Transglycosylase n=1 Tax=Macrococcus bovicus TaxID=69968 RepID=A0A4R6BY36_9STAP|nr:transglycosylase family protein [Macrococcus bovicus]TDM13426.1 transglycosylase [Macrococcus bovicus]
MNKTILSTTLALGLGAALTGQSADAAEMPVNKAELADLAMNHQDKLNAAPIQEGTYDYEFDYNGYHFDFESNGSSWTWKYYTNGYTPVAAPAVTAPAAIAPVKAPVTQAAPVQQAPVQQAPVAQKAAYQAPVSYQAPAQTYSAPKAATTQTSASSYATSSSVDQHLRLIMQRESGGNPRAVNPAGYYGLFQFSPSTWAAVGGTGNPADASVAEQWKRARILYTQYGAQHWTTA